MKRNYKDTGTSKLPVQRKDTNRNHTCDYPDRESRRYQRVYASEVGEQIMKCPKCDTEMIWNNDFDTGTV